MTVYLWHMVPVLIIAVAFYPAGVMPQPPSGPRSGGAPAGLAGPVHPDAGAAGRGRRAGRAADTPAAARRRAPGLWSPALLVSATPPATAWPELAIGGFAPAGQLPVLVLAAYAAGLIGTLLTGRPPPQPARPQALGPPDPDSARPAADRRAA